jgi:hypothetical protein
MMGNAIRRISSIIPLTLLFCSIAIPQDQLQSKGKSETTIDLAYFKKENRSKSIVATVHAKNSDGKFGPAKNARVSFYVMNGKKEQLVESVNSDNRGESVLVLQKDLPLDEDRFSTVVARIENDSLYEDTEEKIHYREASLILNLDPADTSGVVTAKVTEIGEGGKEIPVKNTAVKFYVQRLFGIMPATEENSITTNENGEASFTYPRNIKGDTEGIITLVVRIEDDEQFGNVEKMATVSWGTPLAINKNPFPRALWEPNAPIPLVITVSTLFLSVWLIYFFIFYQLRKIRKEEHSTSAGK